MHTATSISPDVLAARHVVIEAPCGYGKTRMLMELVRRRRDTGEVIVAGSVTELLAAMRGAAASSIVADDVQRWSVDDQRRVADVVAFEDVDATLVLSGRHLTPQLFDTLVLVGAQVIGTNELRLSRSNLPLLFADSGMTEDDVEMLHGIVDGWPLMAARLKRQVASVDPGTGVAFSHPVVVETVDACVAALDADRRHLLGQLAHLHFFSAAAVDALQPGLLHDLHRAGIPLEHVARQGQRLIEPIREVLRARTALDPDLARRMAVALAGSGMNLEAIQLLIRAGQRDAAAQAMVSLSMAQLDAMVPSALRTTLDLLDPATVAHPRLHLVRARALGNAARIDEQAHALDRCIRVAQEAADSDLAVEAEAERLFVDAMRAQHPGELIARIDELTSRVDADQVSVLLRLDDARSLAHASSDRPEDLELARTIVLRTADAWQVLGDRVAAATTMRMAAMTILIPLGRLAEADTLVQRALDLGLSDDLNRLSTLLVAVRLDGLLARPNDRRSSEAAALARSMGLDWAEAYVYWARLLHAGYDGDAGRVAADLERTHLLLGDLGEHATGTVIDAEATESLARSGDLAGAIRLLDRVLERSDECPREADVARLAVAARRHDRREVEEIAADLDEQLVGLPALRWKVDLYRAVSMRDDPARAAPLVQASRRSANHWCGTDVVSRIEEVLVAECTRGGSVSARGDPHGLGSPPPPEASPGDDIVRVMVLGSFRVVCHGNEVIDRSARVDALLKLVALARGRVSVDIVVDRLWPDATSEIGRRRLKNVLTRTRQAVGDVIARDGDVLRFTERVEVDLVTFSDACRDAGRALARGDERGILDALRALEAYGGPLLADDLYDDHVAPLRVAETSRAAALIGAVLGHPSTTPAVGPTIWSSMMTVDPDDLVLLVRFMRWALDHDEIGLATSAAGRIASVSDDLGFEVPSDVGRMLGGVAATS